MVEESRKVTSFLRSQFQAAHAYLEGTLAGATASQAHWQPPGRALPLGAEYAHVVVSEDGVVNGMLKGAPPLMATSWAGSTGLSALPPQGFEWEEWARGVQVDLPALREYAKAVYANNDEYLASLSDGDLDRTLDLSAVGSGQQTLGWFLNVMLGNVLTHCGEISCLKGLQGAKGYPM
jgi:hypothetical protein